MKVFSTKVFSSKIKTFTERDFQTKLLALINFLNIANDIGVIDRNFEKSNNVYFFKLDDFRVFFTVEGDNVLLIDVIKKEGERMPFKNPRIDNTINPLINHSINPRINGSLNPRINGSINPNINGSLNPRINGSLNPKINGSLNPRINGSINPRINGSLNPKINSSLNPRINPSFKGYYFYDLENNPTKIAIKANDKIILIFDFKFNLIEIGVSNTYGFSIFDYNTLNYIYYISSDKMKGFNIFDINNNWIGHVK